MTVRHNQSFLHHVQTTCGSIPVSGYYFHFWPSPRLFSALSPSPSVPMMVNGGRSWLPFSVPSGISLLHFLQKIHPLAVRCTRGCRPSEQVGCEYCNPLRQPYPVVLKSSSLCLSTLTGKA